MNFSGALWHLALRGLGIRHLWRELEAFEQASPEIRRASMGRRMMEQIQHFAALPEAPVAWKVAARARDVEEIWSVWPTLPVMTKADLRGRFSPGQLAVTAQKGARVSATGGSTGEPTPFVHDRLQQSVIRASGLYCRVRQGWRPGMPIVSVWGSERDIGRQRTARGRALDRLRNTWLVDGYALDDGTVDHVLALLQRHQEVAMHGFTSMLEFVARQIARRGVSVPPGRVRTAWNGGETLSVEQSSIFEEVFGVPILNYYGGRELGAMAFQPSADAPLTVIQPWLMVEILDDDDQPAAPGDIGRLVWTSLAGRGTPFIRYDIGDLGSYSAADAGPAGIERLLQLHGRTAGMIRLTNGRVLHGMYFNHLLKEFHEVEQFQIASINDQRLEFRFRGAGFSADREARLRATAGAVIGAGVPFDIRWVERIQLSAQGKLMQVVRETAVAHQDGGAAGQQSDHAVPQ